MTYERERMRGVARSRYGRGVARRLPLFRDEGVFHAPDLKRHGLSWSRAGQRPRRV